MTTGLPKQPVVDDGYKEPPDAKLMCPICGGGGLLDDGDNFGAVMVPCLCTGRASPEVIAKIKAKYPMMPFDENNIPIKQLGCW
jgi:hypothetical protein